MRRNCWGHLWFLIFKGDAIFEMLFFFPETNYGPFADQKEILIKDTEFKDTLVEIFERFWFGGTLAISSILRMNRKYKIFAKSKLTLNWGGRPLRGWQNGQILE